jgi:hypothetical protein
MGKRLTQSASDIILGWAELAARGLIFVGNRQRTCTMSCGRWVQLDRAAKSSIPTTTRTSTRYDDAHIGLQHRV